MNTREVILVGAGVVVGYLLCGFMKKKNEVSASTTQSILPAVDQSKIDACNKEADDFMSQIRPSAGADLVAIRKEKFDACMALKK